MTAAAVTRPYTVPPGGGSGRAIALAVVMHALLAALLVFGVSWQSSPPAVVQAELWSATPQTAAPPRSVPPPRVEPLPTPRVEPRPEPAPPPPKVRVDIAERVPPKKVEPPRKVEPPKPDPPKVQPKPVPKVEPPPVVKAKPEPVRPPPAKTADAPRRPSDVESLLAAADQEVSGKPSTGRDAQTSGPRGDQSGYTAKLQAAIRSQMRYPATAAGNPTVRVHIEQLPSGEVLRVTVVKPSGLQAFDEAVERAIEAASPLPRPAQGAPPRDLDLTYYLYDKN